MATGKHITRGHHLGGLTGGIGKGTQMGPVMDAGRTSDRRRSEVVAEDGKIFC